LIVSYSNDINKICRRQFRADRIWNALEEFFIATDGYKWINNDNWLSSKPISTWHGITATSEFVTEIRLERNNLNGS
jgi:hypothetical protein